MNMETTRPMRVLVACEFSGIVRDAFLARGHDAWSCDLLPTERPIVEKGIPTRHWVGDVLTIIGNYEWDLMIAHPPCTYLTNSAVRWLTQTPKNPRPDILYGAARWEALEKATAFFNALLRAKVKRIAAENPIPHKYAVERLDRNYGQLIQPYWFGHTERKATCLWLKNLPPLMSTGVSTLPKEKNQAQRLHYLPPSPERSKERSRTFSGIAEAMATQWGALEVIKAA